MRVEVIGGDERFKHAAKRFGKRGWEAVWAAEWSGEKAELVVAPSQEKAEGVEAGLMVVQRGEVFGENAFSLERDEEFLRANAFLTAEGALKTVMGKDGRALYGRKCLVAGYGRIGLALYGMLRSMRADVTVAVREGRSMDRAREDGCEIVDVSAVGKMLGGFDLIFNTVPERIFNIEDLGNVRADTGIFDLASAPFGFELEEARALDIWAERVPGIPGKYAPVTAGEILAQAAERIYKERSGKNA